MDIHRKSVDMDMDMDGKFHIHGKPGDGVGQTIYSAPNVVGALILYTMHFYTENGHFAFLTPVRGA